MEFLKNLNTDRKYFLYLNQIINKHIFTYPIL